VPGDSDIGSDDNNDNDNRQQRHLFVPRTNKLILRRFVDVWIVMSNVLLGGAASYSVVV